jgi:hypothetical protein
MLPALAAPRFAIRWTSRDAWRILRPVAVSRSTWPSFRKPKSDQTIRPSWRWAGSGRQSVGHRQARTRSFCPARSRGNPGGPRRDHHDSRWPGTSLECADSQRRAPLRQRSEDPTRVGGAREGPVLIASLNFAIEVDPREDETIPSDSTALRLPRAGHFAKHRRAGTAFRVERREN